MYYVRHRAGMGTLYFAVKIFCISINKIYLVFEGGLLCIKSLFTWFLLFWCLA